MTGAEWRTLMAEGDPQMQAALRSYLLRTIPELLVGVAPLDRLSSTELGVRLWPRSERVQADSKRLVTLFSLMRSLAQPMCPLSRYCVIGCIQQGAGLKATYEWFDPGPHGQEVTVEPGDYLREDLELLSEIDEWSPYYERAQRAIERKTAALARLRPAKKRKPEKEIW